MPYQRLPNPRIIMGFVLVALLVVAVSCGGAGEPTAEPGAPASTVAAPTQAPAAQAPSPTAASAPGTQAAPAAATPAPQPRATATLAPAAPAMSVPEGTLNIGYKELGTFGAHPKLTSSSVIDYVGYISGQGLLTVNADGDFLPKLAKEWSVSPDSLVWTFKLEEGIQFHKGYGEMTAEDVLWSILQAAGENSVSAFVSHYRRLWENEAGYAEAIDDHTIEVHTGVTQYDMLLTLTRPWTGIVVSKKQFGEQGDDEASRNAAGTGPWEILEHRTGEFWKFGAVEEHWQKTPNFAELVLWEIPEESTRVANFQVGRLDTMLMAIDSKRAIADVSGTRFMRVEGGASEQLNITGNWYVGVGTEAERPSYDPDLPWVSSNPDPTSAEWETARKVREAMAISIDRQLIVDTLLTGEGKPLVMWGWETARSIQRLDPDIRAWPYDPERAKQLLNEAGYGDGFEIDVTPHIRDVPAETEACEAVAVMWEQIGIRTKIQKVAFESIVPKLRTRSQVGATCHGGPTRFDPLTISSIIYPSTAGVSLGFDHPFVDERLANAINIVDRDARFEVMNEVHRFAFENALASGLYIVNLIWPLGPKIDDWKPHLEYGDRRVLSGMEYTPHRK